MVEVIPCLFHLGLDVGQLLIGFLDIELGDLTHRLLAEFQHIVTGDLPFEFLAIRVEAALDAGHLVFPGLVVFLLQLLIDAFLEEDLLQGDPMPFRLQLIEQDAQLPTEEFHGTVRASPEDLADAHEGRPFVDDDTGIG